MKKNLIYLAMIFTLLISISSCSNDVKIVTPDYPESVWDTRVYKIERHPTLIRNGFGMDLLREGDAELDVLYMTETTSNEFPYDLMLTNDYAYSKNNAGEWNGSGNPVITLAADVKAAMVGTGIAFFESFVATDIATYKDQLQADPELDLEGATHYHDDSCEKDADGNYTHDEGFYIQNLIRAEYKKLIIGNKFRPNIGGVFECTSDDPEQVNLQPVFLVETKEKAYALFMVTLFQGTGEDKQKTSVTWRLLGY